MAQWLQSKNPFGNGNPFASKSSGEDTEGTEDNDGVPDETKITIGVCALEKKARSLSEHSVNIQ
jgi:hypothetical protein